jgi:hypothetical protein
MSADPKRGTRRAIVRPVVVWALLALGVAVIVVALVLGGSQFETTKTTERVAGKQTKVTSTTSPPSDALLLGLMGLGGVFVVCAVFYDRISKVTFPGGAEIEFAKAQKEAAAAVDRVIQKRRPEEATPQIAAKVAAATTLAAARGVQIERLALSQPDGASSFASVANVPLDVKSLARGGTLSREMWDRLAEAALDEVLPS